MSKSLKILYICSSQFDYLQDLTYSGLAKVLGNENIREYPWNSKYHLSLKEYPKNLGFTSFSIRLPLHNFKNYNLVILGSAKPDALENYLKILPLIKNKPVIFIDGGDLPETGGDFFRLNAGEAYKDAMKKRPFDIILKREYLPSLHESDERIFPFPFSFPYNVHIRRVAEKARKYDVSFWGQQKPEIREKALRLLENKYDCAANGTTLNQNFDTYKRKGKFYLEELAACKIVLNFRGGGWDTMRYWETPAAGSFMISQKPGIVIPNNFEEGKHLMWCDESLNDLTDKIDYYLQHPAEREAMAVRAKDHLNKYHLNTVRAKTLIEIVSKMMGGESMSFT